MSVLDELMLEYVQVLKRFSKAANFMDNPNVSIDDKERWQPEFRSIIEKLDSLVSQMEDAGLKMKDEQILNGFQEVKQ